jgi:L-alanine-DL-glutamate epimerase-like enolase superfamily enzyme
MAAGAIYCPHYLGGGVGLLASAHLLAGVGGKGLLEIDANDNPLRTLVCGPLNDVREGQATLTETPGLGIGRDRLAAIERYRVPH